MAISLDTEERLAAMWAEWFVRDYVTNDGVDSISAEWGDALGIELLPESVPVFVEWVEAFAVTSPAAAIYRVEVQNGQDLAVKLCLFASSIFRKWSRRRRDLPMSISNRPLICPRPSLKLSMVFRRTPTWLGATSRARTGTS